MADAPFSFTTGATTLPDAGQLSYNGCTFGPLFETNVAGKVVKDDASRTTKLMDYALEADGYVTLPAGADSIAPTMATLQTLLSAHGGVLIYKGRGYDLVVNAPGATSFDNKARDVAWGPVPEIIEFQPLGAGLSAKIKWRVTVRLVVVRNTGIRSSPLLQFNCETSVGYTEDYHSTLSIRGTMEIPLTRTNQTNRTLTATVDDMRGQLDTRIFAGIDLSRFRVVKRDYSVSRDKRTLNFDVQVEEKPYMDLPVGCPVARGTFNFRPVRSGSGLTNWLCTLRVTYTVRKDQPRRIAWLSFLALLRLRMASSELGMMPPMTGGGAGGSFSVPGLSLEAALPGFGSLLTLASALNSSVSTAAASSARRAWLVDFSGDEGMYLDSKTTTFAATWRLTTTLSHVLLASGLWRKLPERNAGQNLWAMSMRDVSGSTSWLTNRLDPSLDLIVDFGGG